MENKQQTEIDKDFDIIIVRYSEIALKSPQVRKKLVFRLKNNIKFHLWRSNIHISKIWHDFGLIYISAEKETLIKVPDVLNRILGVYAYNLAITTTIDMETILTEAQNFARKVLKNGDTFGIRAKKVGKHPFKSQELAAAAGERILMDFGEDSGIKVNLRSPDHWIYLLVREDKSYIYENLVKTPWGGNPIQLPRGNLSIMTDRVSDYVSGFMIMKRGFYCLPLLFTEHSEVLHVAVMEILNKFTDYLPVTHFYALSVNIDSLYDIILDEEKTKLITAELNNELRDLIRIPISDWILRNKSEILKEMQVFDNIQYPSNLKILNRKKPYWIDYVSISDGNAISENLDSPKLQDLVAEMPVFQAAISFSDEELVQKFERINQDLSRYLLSDNDDAEERCLVLDGYPEDEGISHKDIITGVKNIRNQKEDNQFKELIANFNTSLNALLKDEIDNIEVSKFLKLIEINL